MAVEKLNNTLVKNLPAEETPYEVRDTVVAGLLVRVQPSGKKYFKLNYGRGKNFPIGDTDSFTVTMARTLAREKKVEAASGKDPQEARRIKKAGTFAEFYKNHYQAHIKENHRGALKAINRYKKLCARVGKIPLMLFSDFRIESFRKERKKEGVSNSTINRDVSALQAMIRYAFRFNFIPEIPFKGRIRKYKEFSEHPRYLSREEESRLREALEARDTDSRAKREQGNRWRQKRKYPLLPEIGLYSDHLTPLVLTAMLTGLRRGELFNLAWQDADLGTGTLHVRAKGAKSGKTRTVPLPSEGLAVLQNWKQLTGYSQPRDYVFPNRKGERLDNVNTSFRNILKAADILGFRFHDLRHHYASTLVQEGVALYTVKELLGHSDFKMTQRYAHLAPGTLAEAVRALDKRQAREFDNDKKPLTREA